MLRGIRHTSRACNILAAWSRIFEDLIVTLNRRSYLKPMAMPEPPRLVVSIDIGTVQSAVVVRFQQAGELDIRLPNDNHNTMRRR